MAENADFENDDFLTFSTKLSSYGSRDSHVLRDVRDPTDFSDRMLVVLSSDTTSLTLRPLVN